MIYVIYGQLGDQGDLGMQVIWVIKGDLGNLG